jgi:hypothetical protein
MSLLLAYLSTTLHIGIVHWHSYSAEGNLGKARYVCTYLYLRNITKVEVHNAYSILSTTEEVPTNEPTTTMPHANQATNVPIEDVKKEHRKQRRARIRQHRERHSED